MPEITDIQDLEYVIAHNNWKYVKHQSRMLTQPGENYGSILLALELDVIEANDLKRKYAVAKLCPSNEVLRKAFLTDVTFKKEILSYRDALPEIMTLENEYCIPESKKLKLFAECYGARLSLINDFVDDDAVILLENLKLKGYDVANRFEGFDAHYTDLILSKLARWHASTVALKLLKPKIYENNVMPCLEAINPGSTMVNGFCDVALHFASKIPECKPYLEKLKGCIERGKEMGGLKFPVKTNDDFYSMIHVDLWTNNIMISDTDGKQVKFVDFQLLDYGSVVRDLLLFLFSSVNIELLEEKLDSYLRFYHNEFVECLVDYKCDTAKFSWEAFMKEVEKVAPHEFFHVIFMLRPIFTEKGSVANMENISKDDFGKIDNVGETYIRRLKYTILTFGEKGWI